MASDLRGAARAWLATDPDPETREVIGAMLDAHDVDALEACFGGQLAFGTAGMRGALGPGPNRMNRAMVRRVSAALAAWVSERAVGDGPVVVGFDGRRGSRAFAEDAARVIAGAGLPVVRFPELGPTPLLAWAVRCLGARAGVMVTASHNPPGDNGYKVYWSDGAQIVPPHDAGIASRIDLGVDPPLAPADAIGVVPDSVEDAYVEAVLGLRVRDGGALRVAYTPLHGVGRDLCLRVLAAAGYTDVHVVPEQAEPDGAFPTVAFPNPEEPGALDLVLALARDVDADLVLANDPDADRIAVAARGPQGWRVLTGDEVGCLLAEEVLAHGSPAGARLVANTVVSSRLLGRIAAHHGAAHVETLTGFKWLARAADGTGARLVLAYEEALGVGVGEVVGVKGGISAALLVCDLAARLREQGRTLIDALDDLSRQHGVHVTTQRSLVRTGDLMRSLRDAPPTQLAGEPVLAIEDGLEPGGARPLTDLLGFVLYGARVLVRPSGTEPKVKVYAEVVEPAGEDLSAARARALERAERLALATVTRG